MDVLPSIPERRDAAVLWLAVAGKAAFAAGLYFGALWVIPS